MLAPFAFPELDIRHHHSAIALSEVDGAELVVYILNRRDQADLLSAMPHGAALTALKDRQQDPDDPLQMTLKNKKLTRLLVFSVDPDWPTFKLLNKARDWVKSLSRFKSENLLVGLAALPQKAAKRVSEALISACLAQQSPLPSYKNSPPDVWGLQTIQFFGSNAKQSDAQTLAAEEGAGLARFLGTAPANVLTPNSYRRYVEELADGHGWQFEFLDQDTLAQRGCGAFLAVTQAAPELENGIVRLRYKSKSAGKSPKLALVGKGLCMDTGGYNLKISGNMFGMHLDMCGSAAALGVLLALTRLEVDYDIDCWLALAENHISPAAYRNNDVVTAANGATIEIVDTDAEGRMVLADTLTLAGAEKPDLILDFATLTGACVRALGQRVSGVFTNTERGHALAALGEACGERVWPFPLYADYDDNIKSDIADIRQCAPGSSPDHIDAARFLQRFIPKHTPWVHMDLSSAHNKNGLAHVGHEVTGFGVRYTVAGLQSEGVLHQLLLGSNG